MPAKKAPAKKAAAKRSATKKPARPRPAVLAAEGVDPTPAQALAEEILLERYDLLPSVERIAGAELTDDGVVEALGLFRDALAAPGDPNRDPRVAIAAAAGAHAAT